MIGVNSRSSGLHQSNKVRAYKYQHVRHNAQHRLTSSSLRLKQNIVLGATNATDADKPTETQQGSEDSSKVFDCVIVGGGISGLTTALALTKKHSDSVGSVLVTESADTVGGKITSRSNDKFLWEEGPNSFTPNDAIFTAAVDANVADQLVLGDPEAPRFVYWENKLRPVPSGIPSLVTFDLMSIFGKIRAGLGAIGIKKPAPEYEETIEQFIKRNLGDEVFFRLIEPFCSGVYAGDPAKLSIEAAFGKVHALEKKGGSLVGGTIELLKEKQAAGPDPPRDPRLPPKPAGQTVGSFRRGLQTLPDGIYKELGDDIVKVSHTLTSVTKTPSNTYKLTYTTPTGETTINAHQVLFTTPSYITANILKPVIPDAAEALSGFYYPPVSAVTLAYPLKSIKPGSRMPDGTVPGFGQLHPRTQGVVTLGTIYSSSLFPDRCPQEMILLLNYIGGATNTKVKDQSKEELVKQVDSDLRKMLLQEDAPEPVVVGLRTWDQSIPQFNVGHFSRLDSARSAIKSAGYDGVKLGGNYAVGVALGKVVEYGYVFAEEAAEYMKKLKQQTQG